MEEALAKIAELGGGSYLFYGPVSVGKRAAAIGLAKQIYCAKGGDNCATCKQIDSLNFPGLFMVEVAEDAKSQKIGIGQVQKLQEELSLSGYYKGKARVVIIDLADNLTPEAQNCLLKTIEEPPENTVVILLSTDPDLLLPTVRSRLQAIYFPPLGEEAIGVFLQNAHNVTSKDSLMAARLSRGQTGRALTLANDAAARETLASIAAIAKATFEQPVFERLLLVPQILTADHGGSQFLDYVGAAVGRQLREGSLASSTAAKYLEAIERCGRYIASNVPAKNALEGLMLELEPANV